MMRLKHFFWGRKGLNTVEVVVILAVVLGIALIFREQITTFMDDLITRVFNPDIIDQVAPSTP